VQFGEAYGADKVKILPNNIIPNMELLDGDPSNIYIQVIAVAPHAVHHDGMKQLVVHVLVFLLTL
jgi:hypothetical protein